MKKLNKKGFTLVELLAVIAILSILIIIMVPGVMSLFEKGKVNTFVTQAQSVYKSAEENFIADQVAPNATTSRTYCYRADTEASGASSSKLDLGGSDATVSYKVVFSGGNMTSLVVTNGEYSITLSNPKVSDIHKDSTGWSEVTDHTSVVCN